MTESRIINPIVEAPGNVDVQIPDTVIESINLELGKKLKALRLQAQKTQADIALYLDISPQQYQKYEKGASKCNITNIYKLANYYNCLVTDLLPGHHDTGMNELAEAKRPYILNTETALTDEAEAMSQLLAIFLRVPSQAMRLKLLNLLHTMFAPEDI